MADKVQIELEGVTLSIDHMRTVTDGHFLLMHLRSHLGPVSNLTVVLDPDTAVKIIEAMHDHALALADLGRDG